MCSPDRSHWAASTLLGDIARAQGMTRVARDAGLSRESLYKALSAERNPGFDTIPKVMNALGLKLHAGVERTWERLVRVNRRRGEIVRAERERGQQPKHGCLSQRRSHRARRYGAAEARTALPACSVHPLACALCAQHRASGGEEISLRASGKPDRSDCPYAASSISS